MNIREIVGLAPVIPVLTITELEHAVPLALALTTGGLHVLEIALRTPVALAAIEPMRHAVPDAVVGVGTSTRPVDFAAANRVGSVRGDARIDTGTCSGIPRCALPAASGGHDADGIDSGA